MRRVRVSEGEGVWVAEERGLASTCVGGTKSFGFVRTSHVIPALYDLCFKNYAVSPSAK